MGIKTFPHPSYSPDLAPCDFWSFPKLRGCCYETTERWKRLWWVIDMLTQEDFHGALQKLLEWYNKCRRRLLWRGLKFHVCTINKSAHTKKVWKLIVCTSYLDDSSGLTNFYSNTLCLILLFTFLVGTVQVHCSRRRLLRRGLEFHVCTINKSAHTKKKSGNLSYAPCT